MTLFRYSRWDGSQQVFNFDEDDIMESLSQDILEGGDLNRALRNMFQRGVSDDQGQRIEGLRDLMDRLKKQRQQQLERFNLESLMDDLKEKVQDVIDTERRGIEKRVEEARDQLAEAGENTEHLQGPMKILEDRAEQSKEKLDMLPDSVGGRIKELSDYDFMDPEAREKVQELLESRKQQSRENFVNNRRQQLQGMATEDVQVLTT